MKPTTYSGHAVDVPEQADEAAAAFDCPIYRCSMPGASCAARHRGGVGGSSLLGTCARCPAGVARARLLAPGAAGAPRVADRLSPAARRAADLVVTTLEQAGPLTWSRLSKASGLVGHDLHQAVAAAAGDARLTVEGTSKNRIYRAAAVRSPALPPAVEAAPASKPKRAKPRKDKVMAVSQEKIGEVVEALRRLGRVGWGALLSELPFGASSLHEAVKILIDRGEVVAEPAKGGRLYRLATWEAPAAEEDEPVEEPAGEKPAAVEEPAVEEQAAEEQVAEPTPTPFALNPWQKELADSSARVVIGVGGWACGKTAALVAVAIREALADVSQPVTMTTDADRISVMLWPELRKWLGSDPAWTANLRSRTWQHVSGAQINVVKPAKAVGADGVVLADNAHTLEHGVALALVLNATRTYLVGYEGANWWRELADLPGAAVVPCEQSGPAWDHEGEPWPPAEALTLDPVPSPASVAPPSGAPATSDLARIQEAVADLRRILRPAPGETLLQAAERLRRVADQADAVAAVAHDIATELGIA